MTSSLPPQFGSFRYVDNVGTNYLFRGGQLLTTDPKTGEQVFDFEGFANAVANPPNPPPVPAPQNYFVVVINLKHPNETEDIIAELNSFANNPDKGQVHLWDTNGTPQCYYQTDPGQRDVLATDLEQWLPDPLIWRVATIRNWLEGTPLPTPAPPDTPIIIYVHCLGGCDRTSELIGAYRLRHMPPGWTMQDAWINMYNEHPCPNPMGCNNYRAVQWYAFWLNLALGYSLSGIGDDGGCNDPGGVWKACSP